MARMRKASSPTTAGASSSLIRCARISGVLSPRPNEMALLPLTPSLVSMTTRHTPSVSSDWSASRMGFDRRRDSAVAVTFGIFNSSPLTLQLGSLLNHRLAQQKNWLNLFGIGHMGGDVLRAYLCVAPQPLENLIGRTDKVNIVAVARLFRRQLLLVGGD